ncbi:MAG: acetyl-CoA carboxylase, biotin carboxyl carrier protein [Acidobacteria bacterium]|nr:acetyl-CoA carboxylase, biotin carboxyl carrier protein [Acidobacteriota bacterium]
MADDELKRFLALMAEHDLEEMEVEQAGLRVRFRKRAARALPVTSGGPPSEADGGAPPATGDSGGAPGPRVMRAPIVGTAYRAPAPDQAPFVEVGARVRKGQVLCLIEAMKLMHEIDAEEDGTVVAIFIENGQAVEYGERLLAIDPARDSGP